MSKKTLVFGGHYGKPKMIGYLVAGNPVVMKCGFFAIHQLLHRSDGHQGSGWNGHKPVENHQNQSAYKKNENDLSDQVEQSGYHREIESNGAVLAQN